jgi:hypothetical protein
MVRDPISLLRRNICLSRRAGERVHVRGDVGIPNGQIDNAERRIKHTLQPLPRLRRRALPHAGRRLRACSRNAGPGSDKHRRRPVRDWLQ